MIHHEKLRRARPGRAIGGEPDAKQWCAREGVAYGTGNNLPTTVSPVGNTRVFHELSARYDGATLSVDRDGNLVSTRSFRTTGPFTLASVGSWYSTYYMIGDLAEVIVYSSALSDADRIATDNYLRTKYGLP